MQEKSVGHSDQENIGKNKPNILRKTKRKVFISKDFAILITVNL